MKLKKIVQSSVRANYVDLPVYVPSSYILIDKRILKVGDRIKFSLFFHEGLKHMVLFLQSNSLIEEEFKEKSKAIKKLYIHESQRIEYESFIGEKLQDTAEDDSIPLDEKIDILYTSTSQLANSLYENPKALENMQRSKKVVEPLLQTIFHNENTIKSFIKIIGYDYYTHTHSLNVSIYSLCLGNELGLEKENLKNLGSAALLHDLGKSSIDHNIVNKPGLLSQEEFERMKTHPALGCDIALSIGINDKNILDGIRHHHEKIDGSGYPDRLKGREISLFPRIIGICDIFDALTTQRSYKRALRSYDAIFMMKTHMHKHLDIKIIDTFIKMLHE